MLKLLGLCWWGAVVSGFALGTDVFAQTRIDLSRQSQNIDFSQALSTKPMKIGGALPSLCEVGEMFYKMDAPPGQNIYGCTATNTWTPQGIGTGGNGSEGGGGTAYPADGSDCEVAVENSTIAIQACSARFGGIVNYFSSATIEEADTNDTAVIYIFIDWNAGTPTLRACSNYNKIDEEHYTGNGILLMDCIGFPAYALPMATVEIVSGTLSSPQAYRASYQGGLIPLAGLGLVNSVTDAGRSITLAADTSIVPLYFSGVGPPGLVGGSRIGSFYFRIDSSQVYACFRVASECTTVESGNWVPLN